MSPQPLRGRIFLIIFRDTLVLLRLAWPVRIRAPRPFSSKQASLSFRTTRVRDLEVLWPSYTSHLNLRPCKQNLTLKLPSARRTALYLFGIRLASLEVIEEHPLVLAFHPPELPPEFVSLRTRTI